MELPLNENRFSISFLILLEMGQAVTRPPPVEASETRNDAPTGSKEVFNRLVGYFQEGLSYFAPKSLIKKQQQKRYPINGSR